MQPDDEAVPLSDIEQLDALEARVGKHMPEEAKVPPLSDLLATLRQLRDQELEPNPSGEGFSDSAGRRC